ncbi:hypothetical protein D047_0129B, partial [Vibrio parahaemolyticus VPTS-2010_2]
SSCAFLTRAIIASSSAILVTGIGILLKLTNIKNFLLRQLSFVFTVYQSLREQTS